MARQPQTGRKRQDVFLGVGILTIINYWSLNKYTIEIFARFSVRPDRGSVNISNPYTKSVCILTLLTLPSKNSLRRNKNQCILKKKRH